MKKINAISSNFITKFPLVEYEYLVYPGSTDSVASGSCLTTQNWAWVPSHGVDSVAHACFRDVSYINLTEF